ncbi:P2RX6 isoform 3, partial [Pan troglodytes]
LAGAGSMGSPGATAGWGLLDYKTEKYVMTRNWRVGALQRLLQFGIVVYVVGSPRQKRLPGAGPGTPVFHHHQTQRGFRHSDQGAWKPAVGCGRLREATSGRERVLLGDQLPCDASPSSGQMPRAPVRPTG